MHCWTNLYDTSSTKLITGRDEIPDRKPTMGNHTLLKDK